MNDVMEQIKTLSATLDEETTPAFTLPADCCCWVPTRAYF